MANTGKAVANTILDLAEAERAKVTPMKLIKLVYYAHGYHLAVAGTPLLTERVQAWPYGPVVPSVYHAFKRFGDSPIRDFRAEKAVTDPDTGELEIVVPKIRKDTFSYRLTKKVWNEYKKFSPIQLSNMTHESGTPWDTIREQRDDEVLRGIEIPDELIAAYFEEILQ